MNEPVQLGIRSRTVLVNKELAPYMQTESLKDVDADTILNFDEIAEVTEKFMAGVYSKKHIQILVDAPDWLAAPSQEEQKKLLEPLLRIDYLWPVI